MASERGSLDIETEQELDMIESESKEESEKVPELASANAEGSSGRRKHKKINRQNSKENVASSNIVHGPRSWKNSRRSRNGYGRGLPKKGNL